MIREEAFPCPLFPYLNYCFRQEYIMKALRGKTLLYVTHQMEFLPQADLILVRLFLPFPHMLFVYFVTSLKAMPDRG